MKKKTLLALLPILCLTACGKQSYAGTYSFKMGKDDSAHMGISLILSDETYTYKEEVKGKKLQFNIDIDSIDEEVKKVINNFTGFYNVQKGSTDAGNRLKIGAEISHETLPELIPEGYDITLDPELLQYILVAYINKKTLTVDIPVSLNDLKYQLAWYGYYFSIDELEHSSTPLVELNSIYLPGASGEDRFGTHPGQTYAEDGKTVTFDDAVAMNERYAREFSPNYIESTVEDGTWIGKVVHGVDDKYYYYASNEHNINNSETVTISDKVLTLTMGKVSTTSSDVNYAEITSAVDSENNEYDLSKICSDNWVFKDYHSLAIGLKKE